MTRSSDGAGLPVALLVSLLLLVGVAGIGLAAGPEVVSPDLDSRAVPQEVTVPEEKPSQGEQTANETYLREALGDDFEIEGDELTARDIDGLPAELVAHASVVVLPSDDDEISCEEGADPEPGTGGVVMSECEERTADGLVIESIAARHSAAGSNFGEVTVRHLRADGNVVVVKLSVLGKPAEGSTTDIEADVSDWLDSIEEALIAAALDDRMRPAPA